MSEGFPSKEVINAYKNPQVKQTADAVGLCKAIRARVCVMPSCFVILEL